MKSMIRASAMIAACLLFAAGILSAQDRLRLEDRLSDPEWKRGFETALAERAAEENIPGQTLRLTYRVLAGEEISADPVRAALRAADIAGDLDAGLRRGVPPAAAVAAYRHTLRNKASIRFMHRRLMDKGMYVPAAGGRDDLRLPETPGGPAGPRGDDSAFPGD